MIMHHELLPSSTTTTMHALTSVDKIAMSVFRLMAYFHVGCSFSLYSAIVTAIAIKAAVDMRSDRISIHHVVNNNAPLFLVLATPDPVEEEERSLLERKPWVSSGSAKPAVSAVLSPLFTWYVAGVPVTGNLVLVGGDAGSASERS